MKKIKNAFAKNNKDFNCFGCSPFNQNGLQMEFYNQDGRFFSLWSPKPHFDGWRGVIHGGIQTTLMDETAEWFLFTSYGRSAVTMELNSRFIKPLHSDKGQITIEAKEQSFNRNIAEIKITIIDSSGKVCTEGTGKFFLFSEEESKEKYNFPDIADFFND